MHETSNVASLHPAGTQQDRILLAVQELRRRASTGYAGASKSRPLLIVFSYVF